MQQAVIKRRHGLRVGQTMASIGYNEIEQMDVSEKPGHLNKFDLGDNDELVNGHAHANCQCRQQHQQRRIKQLRWLQWTLLLVALLFTALVVFAPAGALEGTRLFTRQSSSGSSNVFVDNKYYIIVIVVGAVLLAIMGLCFAMCCCRQA